MDISLKPGHLGRYKDIAELFLKYGRDGADEGLVFEPRSEPRRGEAQPVDPKGEALAKDLEAMGPIFVKFGQLLSTRSDLLPERYTAALARLQDDVGAFGYGDVEESVVSELGVRISKSFRRFDSEPIATASLGQVHYAELRDGRAVAVKVQRPGIRERVAEDLEVLAEVARIVDDHTEIGYRYRFSEMLEEFRNGLVAELDYRREARNMKSLGGNLRDFPSIVVPRPIDDYTTSRILTMEYVHGRKITEVGPLASLEMDGHRLAEELFRAYLHQILVDGIFHADPHPGNVLLTDEKRIALIDLGMVGHISSSMQEQLLKLLLAVSEGRSDEAAEMAIRIGNIRADFDADRFRRRISDLVTQQQGATVGEIEIGTLVMRINAACVENGVRTPPEFTMLGKTLLNLDQIGRVLDETFDPNESVRRNAAEITNRRMMKGMSAGSILATAVEAREFVEHLPMRVNRILDAIADNELKFTVEAIDERTLIDGFQKIANRIAVGLIIAALIIGASLLMRVETTFTILGYPGLAILCFLGAAGIGFWLVIQVLLKDRRQERRRLHGR